jgi:transposase
LEHGTTLLFGLAGVAVGEVSLRADGTRVADVVTDDGTAAACPTGGVFSSARKGKVLTRPKDLPYGEAGLRVRWHKSRWRCRKPRCLRQSFTKSSAEVPAGAGTSGRLRQAVADAVAVNRCVSEVAASYGLSWPTAQRAVAARAAEQAGRRRRRRCWASTRPGGNGPGGCAPPTAGGGGPARGRPSSSTWRPGRACWARSAGGPGPA